MKLRYVIPIILSAGILGLIWYIRGLDIPPPAVSDMSCTQWQREKVGDSLYVVGNNWLHRGDGGLWELYLEGNGFERGVAFGKLTQELLEYQEDAFVETIDQYIPSPVYLRFLKYFVGWFNRKLPEYVPDEYLEEIYGVSLSASPRFNFIASPYLRQLNYHAAHDIGHALQNMHMVGCTSFALWEERTTDSCLLIGRNFDFYVGERFAENKLLCFVNPDSGYRFVMIGWAGMCGVLSGMNEKGLTVTVNAAKSGIPAGSAMPVSLLAREILQYASTVDEAYSIAAKRNLFVSESFLTGSCVDNRASVIEKTPEQQGMYAPEGNRIICTNHFQSETLAGDVLNLESFREGDSPYRYERVRELLDSMPALDENGIATVLRDTRGAGGKNIGLGNEKAINQLIAHHTVIFKPEVQKFWVSTHPYQLGELVAYDADSVFAVSAGGGGRRGRLPKAEGTIAADSLLFAEDYALFLRYREMCDTINICINDKKKITWEVDDRFAKRFVQTNPEMYRVYRLLGDWYESEERYRQAADCWKMALTKEIPASAEKKYLEKKVQQYKNQ